MRLSPNYANHLSNMKLNGGLIDGVNMAELKYESQRPSNGTKTDTAVFVA